MGDKYRVYLPFIRSLAVVMLLALLLSCSSVPFKRYIQKSPNYNDSMPKITQLGIVSDATIVASVDTGDQNYKIYVSIEDSKVVESHMLINAANYMKQKGYEVTFQQAPFVGGSYFSQGVAKRFKVAQRIDADITVGEPPFKIDDSLITDESYKNAMLVIVSSVRQSLNKAALAKSLPSDFFLQGKNVPESLKIIAERTKVNALLINIGEGVYVPAAQRFASGVGSFMFSFGVALATAGTAGVSVTPLPANIDSPNISTWSGLIDLQNGEVLWSNSYGLGHNPLDEDFYQDEWPRVLFYHFQPRTAKN